MITLSQFTNLSENDKAEVTWDGTFLMHKENGNLRYALYSIYDFFVEVTYCTIDNKIFEFQGFENKELLEEYLSKINVSL